MRDQASVTVSDCVRVWLCVHVCVRARVSNHDDINWRNMEYKKGEICSDVNRDTGFTHRQQ